VAPERESCPECGKKWVRVDLAEFPAAIVRDSGLRYAHSASKLAGN
jgi:hypothetical protein